MKKIIFAVLLLMAGFSLMAQNDTYTVTSTASHPAYTVPHTVRVSFETAYPGITAVTWEPMNEVWRATYNNNGRLMHVYYYPAGQSYALALPVIQTQVPETVISKAISLYGNSLYDIKMIKSANNTDVYQIHLMEKGNLKSLWMDENGTEATDVYRH